MKKIQPLTDVTNMSEKEFEAHYKSTKLPFLAVENNEVKRLIHSDRKPMYENEMCKAVGLMATCNACDRIIFEDENDTEYSENGGYCKECSENN